MPCRSANRLMLRTRRCATNHPWRSWLPGVGDRVPCTLRSAAKAFSVRAAHEAQASLQRHDAPGRGGYPSERACFLSRRTRRRKFHLPGYARYYHRTFVLVEHTFPNTMQTDLRKLQGTAMHSMPRAWPLTRMRASAIRVWVNAGYAGVDDGGTVGRPDPHSAGLASRRSKSSDRLRQSGEPGSALRAHPDFVRGEKKEETMSVPTRFARFFSARPASPGRCLGESAVTSRPGQIGGMAGTLRPGCFRRGRRGCDRPSKATGDPIGRPGRPGLQLPGPQRLTTTRHTKMARTPGRGFG